MYRPLDKLQHSFFDFNQPLGMHMNPQKNPYLQYFIGFPGYQEGSPFDASTLTLFRKRLTHEIIMEANEYILDHDDENTPPTSGAGRRSCQETTRTNQRTRGH